MLQFTDPSTPPPGMTSLGPGVAYGYGDPRFPEEPADTLYVWHFCDHHLWPAGPEEIAEYYGASSYWTPGSVALHQVVSAEPLHLEPSLYWPGCCGMHGFVREGRWLSV